MMKKERMYDHVIRLIHSPVRVYDEKGRRSEIYVDQGEQQDVLDCDTSFLQNLLNAGKEEHPVLFLETEQIAYGIVALVSGCIIIGPCCIGYDDIKAAKYIVRNHGMDPEKPYRIFRITFDIFAEVLIMLFETVTDKTITTDEMMRKCFCDDEMIRSMKKGVHGVISYMRENSAIHNPYGQERREQAAIKNGDEDALIRSFNESYVGQIGKLAEDPVRDKKNLAIVNISVACRSAIEGGLLPEIAFSMSDAFIRQTEKMKNVAEIEAFMRQSEIAYCNAVKRNPNGAKQSSVVRSCKQLIVEQLYSRLTVQSLADQLAVTSGYLSGVFLKEEGTRLTDYIAEQKIQYAKEELLYTDHSFNAIAYSLGFASQSHFGQTFKRITGMTPGKYRESFREIL